MFAPYGIKEVLVHNGASGDYHVHHVLFYNVSKDRPETRSDQGASQAHEYCGSALVSKHFLPNFGSIPHISGLNRHTCEILHQFSYSHILVNLNLIYRCLHELLSLGLEVRVIFVHCST